MVMAVDRLRLTLPSARARQPRQASLALWGWALPLALLAAWELTTRFGLVAPHLLPAPALVWREVADLWRDGTLFEHLGITLWRVLTGFALGTLAATVLGALTGYSTAAHRLLDPTIQAIKAVPSLAWVPLFILWLGIFEASKVTLIAVGAFFPVYLNLSTAIGQVDRKLVEVGRMYGFSPLTLVRRVLLPATLPAYVTGLRGGLALAWMFVVAAELMGASQGLGFLMLDGQMTGRPALIIASLILFALMGKASDLALARTTAPWLRWQDDFARMRKT
ncbi:MAG: ABC transporter permease [Geminicoccaceae bacterium]|nr:MAG: ABC transporter permease [Geminicoccaceae bacterium]